MNLIYLQLGSNLGDRKLLLDSAVSLINTKIGRVLRSSKIYESDAWGVSRQPKYLNQILEVHSNIGCEFILKDIHSIESQLGRVRGKKWQERLIDIDVIFFNDLIIEKTDLYIPHKYMHKRRFVLEPLNELIADYIHPKYNKSIERLLNECTDKKIVREYEL
jgi:2-amino-4-hydroxy-6-hydroxymethyldihydropteridine diphosphokinase